MEHSLAYIVQLDTGSSDLWIKGTTTPLPNVNETVSLHHLHIPAIIECSQIVNTSQHVGMNYFGNSFTVLCLLWSSTALVGHLETSRSPTSNLQGNVISLLQTDMCTSFPQNFHSFSGTSRCLLGSKRSPWLQC